MLGWGWVGRYTCTVKNTGKLAGDQILQVYHRLGDAVRATVSKLHPVPIKQLVHFERLSGVGPGQSVSIAIALEPTVLGLTATNGTKVVYPGEHELVFSTGDAAPDVVVTVTA